MREKTGIQREEIGVVEGVEERVHEESPISIREQILGQKGEVERKYNLPSPWFVCVEMHPMSRHTMKVTQRRVKNCDLSGQWI